MSGQKRQKGQDGPTSRCSKKTIWHLGTRCCYWEVRTQAQRSGRQEQDGFPGRSCLRYFALLLLLPEEQFQAIIMHLCLYLPLPTSSFFSSWRMLIRILTINLHLPLYLQAASIDGCAARLSASEVWFFAFCLFLLVVQGLFCRFYLPGAISVQHALSSSTRKRENGRG